MILRRFLWCAVLATASTAALASDSADPYLWLEDVTGERALQWVSERNAASIRELETEPGFAELRSRLLSIYESDERIPYVNKEGRYFYNFWRDANNVRGVWRRTTLEEYRKQIGRAHV